MKLLDSLYTIISDNATESVHSYALRLNPEHFIYKAHFPGEPITPGVCIMQIALELTELASGCSLALSTVKNIKFLRIISPLQTEEICFNIGKLNVEEDIVRVQVTVTRDEDVYAKLSLICSKKAQ